MLKNKIKKPVKVEHLARWFFGNFCAKCAKIDDKNENYGRKCLDKIHSIANKLKQSGQESMTHKEFTILIKDQEFCKPVKRTFHECPICKAFGIKVG